MRTVQGEAEAETKTKGEAMTLQWKATVIGITSGKSYTDKLPRVTIQLDDCTGIYNTIMCHVPEGVELRMDDELVVIAQVVEPVK